MNRKRNRRAMAGASVLVASLVALAACGGSSSGGTSGGSSSGKSLSIDVGASKPITLTRSQILNVGIYTSAASASFGQVEDATLKSEAAPHNIKLTIYDSAFNSALQLKQLQSAVQTKKYSVLGVLPVDGQVICNVLSKDAPAANLLVVPFDQPLCGRFTNEGNELWQPGTLDYISGYNTKATLRTWIDAIAKANPSAKVGIVEGLASDGLSTNTNLLVKEAAQSNPGFKVVSTLNTDYSSEQGYQKTQALLQAHPDVSVVICTQSNITQGAARAIQQANKTKSVFLADYGGDKDVVDLMKKGQVQLTGPTYPASEAKIIIQTLVDVMDGKTVPRFVSVPFHVVTKDNLSSYTPEY